MPRKYENRPFLQRFTGALLTLLLLAQSASGQETSGHFLIGANLAGTGLSGIQGASPVVSPEIHATWQFSEASALAVSGSVASFLVSFDTPAGTGSLSLETFWFEAGLAHRLLTIANSVEVIGNLGGGMTSIHRPEEQIALGGLGTTTIPAATDSRAHVVTGIRLTREIVDAVRLHLGTNVRLLSPFSSPETGYSVYGGFSIEVL